MLYFNIIKIKCKNEMCTQKKGILFIFCRDKEKMK